MNGLTVGIGVKIYSLSKQALPNRRGLLSVLNKRKKRGISRISGQSKDIHVRVTYRQLFRGFEYGRH